MAAIPTSVFYKEKSVLLLPLIANSALTRAPVSLHRSWGISQVSMAVSCKLTDAALNTCKCKTAGAKAASRSE